MRKLRVRFSVWTVAGSADRTTIVVPFCMLRFSKLFVSATVSQDSQRSTSHRSVVRSGPPPTCSAVLPRGTWSEMWRLRWSSPQRFGSVLSSMGNDNVVRRICVTLGTVPIVNRGSLSTNRTVQRHAGPAATGYRARRPGAWPPTICGCAARCGFGQAARQGPPKRLRTRRRF